MKKNIHIAIVGAGLAGLTSAYRLLQLNEQEPEREIEITVFEAAKRVGGRIRTLHRKNGLYAEAGALLLTNAEEALVSLIKEMGLELVPREEYFKGRFFINGELTSIDPAGELRPLLFQDIAKWMQAAANSSEDELLSINTYLDQTSMLDYCVQKGFDKEEAARLLSPIIGLLGDNFAELSALYVFQFFSTYLKCTMLHSIAGGNDQLTETLAKKLNSDGKERILLNTPVSQVERRGNRWEVTFNREQEQIIQQFDYVIMAVPLSALQNRNPQAIQLPNLPAERFGNYQ